MDAPVVLHPEVVDLDARAATVREELIGLGREVRRNTLKIGALLWEARERRYLRQWKAQDLYRWAEQHLGLAPRTVRDWIANYQHFVLALHYPAAELEPVGWSKLALLRSVADQDNAGELLRTAKATPERELREIVRARQRAAEPQDVWVERRLSFPKTIWERYDKAMAAAKIDQGLNDDVSALEAILLDFLLGLAVDGKRSRMELVEAAPEKGDAAAWTPQ